MPCSAAARAGRSHRRPSRRRRPAAPPRSTTRRRSRTRRWPAFEVAAHDEGAHVTYIGPEESQLGYKESMKDTARVLGRMYDGIEYRGFSQDSVEILGAHAGVPVWNGLTDTWRPTQMLADILTMGAYATRPLRDVTFCYLGDGRNNVANSLLVTGAMLGMDTRICAPDALRPSRPVWEIAARLAKGSGARLTVTDDLAAGVEGADFLYTDVWLSMGEPPSEWDSRIDQLIPYQVNADVLAATGNPGVRFMPPGNPNEGGGGVRASRAVPGRGGGHAPRLPHLPHHSPRRRPGLRPAQQVRRPRLRPRHGAASRRGPRQGRPPGRAGLAADGPVPRARGAGRGGHDQAPGEPGRDRGLRRRRRHSPGGRRSRQAPRGRGRRRQGPDRCTAGPGGRRRRPPAADRRRGRYGRVRNPQARPIRRTTARQLRARSFPGGSMGPKVEAVCRFVEKTGGMAAIRRLDDAAALLDGTARLIGRPGRM